MYSGIADSLIHPVQNPIYTPDLEVTTNCSSNIYKQAIIKQWFVDVVVKMNIDTLIESAHNKLKFTLGKKRMC